MRISTLAVSVVLGVSHPAAAAERISALLTRGTLRDDVTGVEARFTRDSMAVLNNGQPVASGAPRFEPMAISTVHAEDWLTTLPSPGPRCLYNGRFLGIMSMYHNNPGSKTLWISDDAVTWSALYTFQYDVMSVFVTPGNALLVCTYRPSPGRLYRSEDGGQTFNLVQILPARSSYVRHWSYDVLDGAIFVGEYGDKNLPNNARHVLRSTDDGRTWQIVYAPPETQGYHVHKILADPYDHCVWHTTGDSGHNSIRRSCDAGTNWEAVAVGDAPTSAVARPEAIYWGGDFNVDSWATVERWDRFTGQSAATLYVDKAGYVWDMLHYKNVMYATLYHYQLTVTPTLWASRNGSEWVMLREFPLGQSGLEIFGPVRDGWMHNSYLDGQQPGYLGYRYRPPRVRSISGLRVEPEATNGLASVQLSSAEEGLTGWYAYNWGGGSGSQVAWDTTTAHHGNASVHVTSAPGSFRPGVQTSAAAGVFPAGTAVKGTIWMKGAWLANPDLRAHFRDHTNQRDGPKLMVRATQTFRPIVVSYTPLATSYLLDLVIYDNRDSASADFHVDSAMIVGDGRPLSWQIGGTPRTAESLMHTINYPPAWTESWFWQAANAGTDLMAQPLVVKSWLTADGNAMWLSYEPGDDTFKVWARVDGFSWPLASTPPVSFRKDSLFRMAVAYGPAVFDLYVYGPTGRMQISGPSQGLVFDRTMIGCSPELDKQACGLFAYHQTFGGPLSEQQIVASFDAPFPVGDLDGDGDTDLADFVVFQQCFSGSGARPAPGCDHADLDDDGDVDLADFLIFQQNFTGSL